MNMPIQEDVIFQTTNIDKIYVKEQTGYYQRIRRYLGWVLTCIFVALPFLQYQNNQAILFDVSAQSLTLFSVVLFPQDLLIFAFVFILSAIGLFFLSAQYGRIWCGYACPQTIWTTLFMWVEHRTEGSRNKRILLDEQPWTLKKLGIKLYKHSIWLLISIITATVFMSYFYPATSIYVELINLELPQVIALWIAFFAGCTYLNGGLIREKMCEHMCPYARFQSVMVTPSTKVVTYDSVRGELRGPRKRNEAKPKSLGDCIDCNLCVQVCPVGIDIRHGMQYQCISCGLCIDACDQTMKQFNYQTGLIKYANQSSETTSVTSKMLYMVVIAIIMISITIWINFRSPMEISITKDRNILYRTIENNRIENAFQVKLFNKSNRPVSFDLQLEGVQNFKITSNQHITVDPFDTTITTVTVVSPSNYQALSTPFNFVFKQAGSIAQFKKQSNFHAVNYKHSK